MPSRKTSRLMFGPSDSSYRKTQTFTTINDSVETQKVVRRTLSVRGMGTIRAFYLATHFPAPQKKPAPRATLGEVLEPLLGYQRRSASVSLRCSGAYERRSAVPSRAGFDRRYRAKMAHLPKHSRRG